jgi:hypothetical protein
VTLAYAQCLTVLWNYPEVSSQSDYFLCHFKGWPGPYIRTVHDRMYGDFPAKNTECTPYLRLDIWFWPTLVKSLGRHTLNSAYAWMLIATPNA